MPLTAEQLFARFQRDRDPVWLGRVFDLTAPELLRIAVHLAGDAADAEDLVQSTFLVAIESAASYDVSRRLFPWLSGILVNQARLARRRARKRSEVEQIDVSAEPTPLAAAEERELSGALATALDRLPEAYRTVMILHLRHGLTAADIAHTLHRSPGSVRVQLHRGLQMLRRLLPAGFAAAMLPAIVAPRGLAAVRDMVMSKAGVRVGAKTSVVIAGGAVVATKIALIAGAVGALALACWWLLHLGANDHGERTPYAVASSLPASARPDLGTAGSVPDPARAAIPTPANDGAVLSGTVVSAEDLDPIGRARVQVFAPRRTRLSELKQRWSDLLEQDLAGRVSPRGSWPLIKGEQTDLALLDREEVLVFDAPPSASPASGEACTDEHGRFQLALPTEGAVLVVHHPDYEDRVVAVPASTEVRIPLWSPRHLAGHLVDAEGEPLREPLRVLFVGQAGADRNDCWVATCSGDGEFDLDVGAAEVTAISLTPGRSFANVIDEEERACRLAVDEDASPVTIAVRSSPILCVRDAASGAPVERFSMLSRDLQHDWLQRAGSFYAKDGVLDLSRDVALSTLRTQTAVASSPLLLVVWTENHAARTLDVLDLGRCEKIDVALERGSAPSVGGHVLDRGAPLASVPVSLQAFHALAFDPGDCQPVGACLTAADGSFEISAPPGEYALQIASEGAGFREIVDVPTGEPLRVDVSEGASVSATVHDRDGTRAPGRRVFLIDAGRRQRTALTDGDGEVTFAGIAPGQYSLYLITERQPRLYSTLDTAEVELAPGDSQSRELRLPDPQRPRYLRMVAEGISDYTGWRARNSALAEHPWVSLATDGLVPIDVQSEAPVLEIEDPARFRWHAWVPPRSAGDEVELSRSGPAVEGIVIDDASSRPRAHLRVIALQMVRGEVRATVSALTDESGHFRLNALEPVECFLWFHESPDAVTAYDVEMRAHHLQFRPDDHPSPTPRPIEIRLPVLTAEGFEHVQQRWLSGRVTRSGTLEPVRAGRVSVTGVFRRPSGNLLLALPKSVALVSADGRYRVAVPVAPRYLAKLEPDGHARERYVYWESDASSGDEEHDLLIR
jgi:RNA polymerase sigma-70 factor (ECF subfamily)